MVPVLGDQGFHKYLLKKAWRHYAEEVEKPQRNPCFAEIKHGKIALKMMNPEESRAN
jgi:hypothetical protein